MIKFPGINVENNTKGNAIKIRSSVRVASSVNVNTNTVSNIDGISLNTGDRFLLVAQTNAVENGIWIRDIPNYRAIDLDIGTRASFVMVPVNEGTTSEDLIYMCKNDTPNDIVGTDNLTWIVMTGDIVSGTTDNSILKYNTNPGKPFTASNTILQDSGTSTLIVPNLSGGSDNLVLQNEAQSLENKTIISTSNQIRAGELLLSNGSGIDITSLPSGASPFLLVAQNATSADWTSVFDTPSGVVSTVILEQEPVGTNAPNLSANTWTTRGLNILNDSRGGTESNPSSNGLELIGNAIRFPSGKYSVYATTVGFRLQDPVARLRDITNNTNLAFSNTATASGFFVSAQYALHITTVLDFSATTDVVLQIITSTGRTNGQGVATGFTVENYSLIKIEKIE